MPPPSDDELDPFSDDLDDPEDLEDLEGLADETSALDAAGEVRADRVRAVMAHLFHGSRAFPAIGDDRFANELPEAWRELVGIVVEDLRNSLLAEDESTHRLYPTAYPDDEERNADFTAFAHDQLLMARLEGLDVVERTLESDTLTTAELTAWMQAVNQARLVLGTRLDVSEDDPREADPDDPEVARFGVYHLLGRLLGDLVDALHPTLPPVADDGPPVEP